MRVQPDACFVGFSVLSIVLEYSFAIGIWLKLQNQVTCLNLFNMYVLFNTITCMVGQTPPWRSRKYRFDRTRPPPFCEELRTANGQDGFAWSRHPRRFSVRRPPTPWRALDSNRIQCPDTSRTPGPAPERPHPGRPF